MSSYPANLTEKQWQVIKNVVDLQEKSRKTSFREIINASSIRKCRMLPSNFVLGKQFVFRIWKLEGDEKSCDYESLNGTAETMVFIQIVLNRFYQSFQNCFLDFVSCRF